MKMKYTLIPGVLGLSLMVSPNNAIAADTERIINLQNELSKNVNADTSFIKRIE